MVYVNAEVSKEILREMYNNEGKGYFLLKDKISLDFEPNRYESEMVLFDKLKLENKNIRILEIGCSTGSFLKTLAEAGYRNAQGIDLSETSVGHAQKIGLNCVAGDFLKMNFDNGSYNLIVMWATLEHLLHPREFCVKACECLQSGGHLLISVPNYSSLTQKLLGKRNRYVGEGHLNYFTSDTLEALLRDTGFECVGSMTCAINPFKIFHDLLGKSNMGSPQYKIDAQRRSSLVKRAIRRKSFASYLYRGLNVALNAFNLGDLLIVAARKG